MSTRLCLKTWWWRWSWGWSSGNRKWRRELPNIMFNPAKQNLFIQQNMRSVQLLLVFSDWFWFCQDSYCWSEYLYSLCCKFRNRYCWWWPLIFDQLRILQSFKWDMGVFYFIFYSFLIEFEHSCKTNQLDKKQESLKSQKMLFFLLLCNLITLVLFRCLYGGKKSLSTTNLNSAT